MNEIRLDQENFIGHHLLAKERYKGCPRTTFCRHWFPEQKGTHQKIYFLRRWLAAGEETSGEDGSAGGGEEEEVNAANLPFLRNSQ